MVKISYQLTETEGKFLSLMKGIYKKLGRDITLKKIENKGCPSILITPI